MLNTAVSRRLARLLKLSPGSVVAVQNQTGRFPKKLNLDNDKVVVRMDGSRRLNRRFVKKNVSPLLHVVKSLPLVVK